MDWTRKRTLILIFFALTVYASSYGIRWSGQEAARNVYTLPLSTGDWEGSDISYDHDLLTSWLGTTHIVFRSYQDHRRGYMVTLYLAYYPDIGSADMAHAPEVCYPGQGWSIRSNDIVECTISGRQVWVKRLAIEKASQEEVVYSWWQTGRAIYARNSTYHLSQIFRSMVSRDTSAIWVRISAETNSMQGKTNSGEEAIRIFCTEVAPMFDLYFKRT